MAKNTKILSSLLLAIILVSCGEDSTNFQLEFQEKTNTYHLNDSLIASVKNPDGKKIDSIVYSFGETLLGKTTGSEKLAVVLDGFELGKHFIEARIHSEGKEFTIKKEIKLLYNKKPVIYTYKILNVYPHDINAYTQGLEFHNGFLFESTGMHGQSSLRKTDYKTGKVLKKIDLETRYFGEGLTVLNGKIHLLTWQAGKGFVFDARSFEKLKTFEYHKSKEGWGLTSDGTVLYKSDGTEKIWKLDPETHEEIGYFQTVTHHGITTKLNELEWVEGKIYANTYLKDSVAIIDPENGAITGLIDFRGLREKVTQHDKLDVLNGIAYNPETETLFVTGKNWDKLFEVEIIEK